MLWSVELKLSYHLHSARHLRYFGVSSSKQPLIRIPNLESILNILLQLSPLLLRQRRCFYHLIPVVDSSATKTIKSQRQSPNVCSFKIVGLAKVSWNFTGFAFKFRSHNFKKDTSVSDSKRKTLVSYLPFKNLKNLNFQYQACKILNFQILNFQLIFGKSNLEFSKFANQDLNFKHFASKVSKCQILKL